MSDTTGKFYVYLHRYASGPKQGKVFYVGKGSSNRAWVTNRRSDYWINTYKKYGMTVDIPFRFNNETCAFSIEIALISFYGIDNLCNFSIGGDGPSGNVWTDEQRKAHSIIQTGRKHKPETIEKMRKYQSANHPMKGKKHSEDTKKKMSLSRSGRRHAMFNPNYISLSNGNGVRYFGTMYDFVRMNDVDRSSVSKLIRGKIKSHKGWVLE